MSQQIQVGPPQSFLEFTAGVFKRADSIYRADAVAYTNCWKLTCRTAGNPIEGADASDWTATRRYDFFEILQIGVRYYIHISTTE